MGHVGGGLGGGEGSVSVIESENLIRQENRGTRLGRRAHGRSKKLVEAGNKAAAQLGACASAHGGIKCNFIPLGAGRRGAIWRTEAVPGLDGQERNSTMPLINDNSRLEEGHRIGPRCSLRNIPCKIP
jgi:hypothetical protein